MRIILTDTIISEMTIREINRHFRREDESDKFPIGGRFNATERALRRLRKLRREGLVLHEGLEYYLALDAEISQIVNDQI